MMISTKMDQSKVRISPQEIDCSLTRNDAPQRKLEIKKQ
jgi:hypothetical protein